MWRYIKYDSTIRELYYNIFHVFTRVYILILFYMTIFFISDYFVQNIPLILYLVILSTCIADEYYVYVIKDRCRIM